MENAQTYRLLDAMQYIRDAINECNAQISRCDVIMRDLRTIKNSPAFTDAFIRRIECAARLEAYAYALRKLDEVVNG